MVDSLRSLGTVRNAQVQANEDEQRTDLHDRLNLSATMGSPPHILQHVVTYMTPAEVHDCLRFAEAGDLASARALCAEVRKRYLCWTEGVTP